MSGAERPYKVLKKSTNKAKSRDNLDLSVNSDSDNSSASSDNSEEYLSFGLKDKISSEGGLTSLITSGGVVKKEIYVFPTKILTPKGRENCVKEFVSTLYKRKGENKSEQINQILDKLAPTKECTKAHLPQISKSSHLAQNVRNLPTGGFIEPAPKLAISTPGPRLSRVPDISTPRTVSDSLRVINHLQLSEDDCRYVRGISLIGLSTEYSVKKLKGELLGNNGQGWVKGEKISLKKWYRKKKKEDAKCKNGLPERKQIVIGRIPKEDISSAVQHWASTITERGDFIEMQSLENCPKVLEDTVVMVVGNDSGQGYCREGIRFCNRKNANSGHKVFVTTVMEGSDKALSLFQKQDLFSSLSALKNLTTIKMGGKERTLIKFSSMDYEAAAEDFGTQVELMIFIS